MMGASPPCLTCGRSCAAFGQICDSGFAAFAEQVDCDATGVLPEGADHRRIMAKHGVGVGPLLCLDFGDCGRACAGGGGGGQCSLSLDQNCPQTKVSILSCKQIHSIYMRAALNQP